MSKPPNRHVVGISMPLALYNRIAKLAAAEHRTVSNFLVKSLLEKFGEDKPHANGAAHKPASAKQHIAA